MKKKERLAAIVYELKKLYPEALCSLEYGGVPWKLLVMGRLSAQCTDARVNTVSRGLFERYPTYNDIARSDINELESYIKSCGLYKTKAHSIKEACAMLEDKYKGVIPDNMEELLDLPGIGRKTANLLLGDIYGKPAVVTDTHCIRICGRFGFYPEEERNPLRVEKILSRAVKPEEQTSFCHRLVRFGREYCTARSPRCNVCPVAGLCSHGSKLKNKTET